MRYIIIVSPFFIQHDALVRLEIAWIFGEYWGVRLRTGYTVSIVRNVVHPELVNALILRSSFRNVDSKLFYCLLSFFLLTLTDSTKAVTKRKLYRTFFLFLSLNDNCSKTFPLYLTESNMNFNFHMSFFFSLISYFHLKLNSRHVLVTIAWLKI